LDILVNKLKPGGIGTLTTEIQLEVFFFIISNFRGRVTCTLSNLVIPLCLILCADISEHSVPSS